MKTNDTSHVVVIIPALNEEEGIRKTTLELQEVLVDPVLLLIDGNSTDRTVEVAKEMSSCGRIEVIAQKGSGKGKAIAQAIDYIDSRAYYVVFIDADFTYPARNIPKMIEILEKNSDIGMVNGNRFETRFTMDKGNARNAFYIGNRFLAFVQFIVNGVQLRDPLTGLRVVRREILNNWKPKSKGFDIEVELNYLVERKGYRIFELPIEYRTRLGDKKLKIIDGLPILRRILINAWVNKKR